VGDTVRDGEKDTHLCLGREVHGMAARVVGEPEERLGALRGQQRRGQALRQLHLFEFVQGALGLRAHEPPHAVLRPQRVQRLRVLQVDVVVAGEREELVEVVAEGHVLREVQNRVAAPQPVCPFFPHRPNPNVAIRNFCIAARRALVRRGRTAAA
jgi:hypothetical protein